MNYFLVDGTELTVNDVKENLQFKNKKGDLYKICSNIGFNGDSGGYEMYFDAEMIDGTGKSRGIKYEFTVNNLGNVTQSQSPKKKGGRKGKSLKKGGARKLNSTRKGSKTLRKSKKR